MSKDGDTFKVPLGVAKMSELVKSMMDGTFCYLKDILAGWLPWSGNDACLTLVCIDINIICDVQRMMLMRAARLKSLCRT